MAFKKQGTGDVSGDIIDVREDKEKKKKEDTKKEDTKKEGK